uniref:Uncharacterized protein n=1 Tax=Molossus molossus TaxID=27622 RepID=A0A7J8BN56_MOLMO|nr:hypothetical protein HJG59_010124 [Molossus molossus]
MWGNEQSIKNPKSDRPLPVLGRKEQNASCCRWDLRVAQYRRFARCPLRCTTQSRLCRTGDTWEVTLNISVLKILIISGFLFFRLFQLHLRVLLNTKAVPLQFQSNAKLCTINQRNKSKNRCVLRP